MAYIMDTLGCGGPAVDSSRLGGGGISLAVLEKLETV
jgi:hypothetical protein